MHDSICKIEIILVCIDSNLNFWVLILFILTKLDRLQSEGLLESSLSMWMLFNNTKRAYEHNCLDPAAWVFLLMLGS